MIMDEAESMKNEETQTSLQNEQEPIGNKISKREMVHCSPSTSFDSNSRTNDPLTLIQSRKLIRIPCDSNNLPFSIHGGANNAKLILCDIIRRDDLLGILCPDDRILSIQDIKISGMCENEVTSLLEKLCFENEQIVLEIIENSTGFTDDLREILATTEYSTLHNTIRENLYSKTIPYTTRPAKEGEVNGEHYKFVTEEEFNTLQAKGMFLERGLYQGYLYGTSVPFDCSQMISTARGPLPPNWEIGYDENGDKYFIDHNSGSTTWVDPRDLPDGWEQVHDAKYGTFYVDHINKRTTYERPTFDNVPDISTVDLNEDRKIEDGYVEGIRQLSATSNEYIFTKDPSQLRGNIIITHIVKGPKGLGFTLIGNDSSSKGDEFIQVKSILPGGPAAENGQLRPGDILVRVNGHLLLGASQTNACHVFVNIPAGENVEIQVCRGYPFLFDPTNRIITENVYATGGKSRDIHEIEICKGHDGFGFTIADSVTGQRVNKVLYPAQCPNLMEGDIILELDGINVRSISHTQLVDKLRECPIGYKGSLMVKRSSPKHRSRTPTAAFRYGEERTTPPVSMIAPRSKTPAPTQKQTEQEMMSNSLNMKQTQLQRQTKFDENGARMMKISSTTLGFATPNYMPLTSFQVDNSDLITVNLIRKPQGFGFRLLGGKETDTVLTVGQIVAGGAADSDGRLQEADEIVEIDSINVEGSTHAAAVSYLEIAAQNKHVKMIVRRPKNVVSGIVPISNLERPSSSRDYDVVLSRSDSDGFGFIIISSLNRSGSTIGQILENSPASRCGKLHVGDRVICVNGIDIMNLSHGEIVSLIKASGLNVRLTIVPPENIMHPLATSTLNRNNYRTEQVPGAYSNYGTYSSFGPVVRDEQYSQVPPSTSAMYAEIQRQNSTPFETPQQDGPLLSVELERGSRGFGFSIRGGQEFGAMPLFVLRIAEDGPAAFDGRLRVGDQLISINGCDTKGLTHEEAIQLIKQHPSVRLTVRRLKLP